MEGKLEYQRVCVNTEDGGVISLDWPSNLDLHEEHGLDTTLLLVPGTAEGSIEKRIRLFACEALRRGFFPVVMNPRGCGGSPLTTSRLFTAADSDDICTAIQFIGKARPWTTLMSVGWGYGANMLTKYLAEVGERTPLTAVTCIDNPFDLEEATRSSPHHIALDEKLANGLIDILRSNKELFKGRAKGFDVEKALSAKSVRDFEKAISMVSYGFEAIEDFYSKSSTRGVVGNIKIPVLFIQNDAGAVPPFSIPRSSIAENPFTSLLLCSCLPSSVIGGGRAAESWCQNLVIEWLSAVELGLLKGRHPLLKDVDVTINPSGSLALVEGRETDKRVKVNKLVDLVQTNTLNGYPVEASKQILEDSYSEAHFHLRSGQESQRNLELDHKGSQDVALQEAQSVDTDLVEEGGASPDDGERGQVLQTAQVVLNMLDVTVPGTLTEEQKRKVLTGVGQGETLVKALQDAVPEDVRGKLMTAVSGILHAESANLKLDGLLGKIPNVSSESKIKVQEKVGGLSSSEGLYKDANQSDQVKRVDDLADSSDNIQPGLDKPAGRIESEIQPSENLQKSADVGQSQSVSSHQGDISSSVRKGTNESGNSHENDVFNKEKAVSNSDITEKASEIVASSNLTGQSEKAGGSEEANVKEDKVEQDAGVSHLEPKPEKNQRIGDKTLDSSTDQTKTASTNVAEEAVLPLGSSSEAQIMEKEGSDNEKRENKSLQPAGDQNKSTTADPIASAFSVSEALDALTGMDDSTQMAVNSVFGVIENMISQLEGKSNENEVKERNEAKDDKIDCIPEKHIIGSDLTPGKEEDHQNELSVQSHTSHDPSVYNSKPLADYSVKLGYLNNIPLYVPVNLYGDSSQHEYLPRYPSSKLPNTKPLDLDTTTTLFLDYFPEEGQWKLLEQPGNVRDSIDDVSSGKGVIKEVQDHSFTKVDDADKFIEPPYVILDTDKKQEPFAEYEMKDNMNENDEDTSAELIGFVKNIILDSLKIEVDRRLGPYDRKEMESDLARDLERVATDISLAIVHDEEHIWCLDGKRHRIDCTYEKVGTLQGENIFRAISTAVQGTSYLRRVLPVGVIAGSCLAALREYFNVSTEHENDNKEPMAYDLTKKSGERKHDKARLTETEQMRTEKNTRVNGSMNRGVGAESEILKTDSVMVGAVTAALGASALMEIAEPSSKAFVEKGNHQKEPEKLISEKNQDNIVTSLAEKAMSVASPVVPTKEDGEVDQERLVAMLADLGQKGGLLKLVGKLALLWGGLRGAMSLTEKLILFLHLADRPLLQRILGFVGMVLVLWSPVLVPLLPTIVQSWTTNNPSRIAEFACIVGLYIAVMILTMKWGRRVRGYENSLEQYGLDITSLPKVQNFLKGLIAGVMLVLLIQSLNAVLGCVSFSWPSIVTSSLTAMAWLKVYGNISMLACQGIVTATVVVLVEELLFRSWLPEEIAADLDYHRGIIISGLAFALSQRSPQAIPGLWLLSLALAGVRQRSQGSLSVPIGLRTGIMASSFVLQKGGLLTYKPSLPLWITGTHPFQPFSGVVGLAFSLILAIILYPRQPLLSKKLEKEH
ncbi:alpha/beta-Hydrolases superfamily protein [Citrus sinensis]|uniref:Alpha/beta-Hydrolases superfamily protein n=1 Tax=Citrus sinensis TaxID=2711 RepID=A0ACB8P425_CITSI|nr:alpha/beta-Hydrolases superfamily protein [Citrus sinensis]